MPGNDVERAHIYEVLVISGKGGGGMGNKNGDLFNKNAINFGV